MHKYLLKVYIYIDKYPLGPVVILQLKHLRFSRNFVVTLTLYKYC